MTENKRTKTIEFHPTEIFNAREDENIEGDLEIYMYKDGSILFVGASILENQEFVSILRKIDNYLNELTKKE